MTPSSTPTTFSPFAYSGTASSLPSSSYPTSARGMYWQISNVAVPSSFLCKRRYSFQVMTMVELSRDVSIFGYLDIGFDAKIPVSRVGSASDFNRLLNCRYFAYSKCTHLSLLCAEHRRNATSAH